MPFGKDSFRSSGLELSVVVLDVSSSSLTDDWLTTFCLAFTTAVVVGSTLRDFFLLFLTAELLLLFTGLETVDSSFFLTATGAVDLIIEPLGDEVDEERVGDEEQSGGVPGVGDEAPYEDNVDKNLETNL